MTKKQALFFLIIILLLTTALASLTYFLAKRRAQPEKIPWANTNAQVQDLEPPALDTSGWLTYRNDLIEFSYPKSFGDYKDKYLYDDFDRNKIVGREIVFKEQGIKIEYAIPYAIIGRETRGVEGQLGETVTTEPDLLEYCKRHEYYNCQKLTLDGFEFVEFYYPVYSIDSEEFFGPVKVLLGRTPNETYPGLYLHIFFKKLEINKEYTSPLSREKIIDLIDEIENSTSDERLEFFEIFKETLTFVQT